MAKAKAEPVIVVASIVTAVQSILAALVLLGVIRLDAEQIAAIILAVQGVLAVPAAFLLRSKVKPWPPDRPEWVPEPFAELDDHLPFEDPTPRYKGIKHTRPF